MTFFMALTFYALFALGHPALCSSGMWTWGHRGGLTSTAGWARRRQRWSSSSACSLQDTALKLHTLEGGKVLSIFTTVVFFLFGLEILLQSYAKRQDLGHLGPARVL